MSQKNGWRVKTRTPIGILHVVDGGSPSRRRNSKRSRTGKFVTMLYNGLRVKEGIRHITASGMGYVYPLMHTISLSQAVLFAHHHK